MPQPSDNLLDEVISWLEREKAHGRRRAALSPAARDILAGPPPGVTASDRTAAPPAPAPAVPAPEKRPPPRENVPPPTPRAPLRPAPPPAVAPAVAESAAPAAVDLTPLDLSSETMETLPARVAACTRCRLCRLGRQQTVFGEGNPHARLMFIGEGPGADEDAQGRPFVGAAGQTLTRMIVAMHLQREDVYIANVVKCRPPNNRTPDPDEGSACMPYLLRQVELIKPEAIVLLGATPLLHVLGIKGIMRARGAWREWRGIPVMPTYHPAFLLRSPAHKRETWADLQMVMQRLRL